MYSINTLLVGLDNSEMDDTLIDYVIRFSQRYKITHAYFINVQKSLDLPSEILEKYPDLIAPKDEQVSKIIEDKIKKSDSGALNCTYTIEVIEGNATEQILKRSRQKEVDLIILGKKLSTEGSGISAGKIVKLSHCSVFFIPEVVLDQPENLIVPVDFSPSSKIALEQAIFLSKQNPDIKVSCVHFYEVPSGYHYSGKDYDEFAELMKTNAEKLYQEFIKKIDTAGMNLTCDFILDKSDNVAKQIYKYAVKKHSSGIVMGSRGRTAAASFVLGSVTEKLIHINEHLPLFIAKEKNHNLNFLEALFGS